MFALKVQGSEARSGASGNPIIGREGSWYWVCNEQDNWVEATGMEITNNYIPQNIKRFKTIKSADRFAKRWKGHPWWVKPNGNFKIVELKPMYKKVLTSWKIK